MPTVRRLWCWTKGIGDARYVARTGRSSLPPADLRFFVGAVDRDSYFRIGQRCAADLQDALRAVGRDWSSFVRVLDFGCGCGRTLNAIPDDGPEVFGCDRHEGCIAWCRTHFEASTFSVNESRPPLDYGDGTFDLIYAISVFTHLDESEQFDWLRELQRVTCPGAVCLLSVHGRPTWNDLTPDEVAVLERKGFFAKPVHALEGVFPAYYNTYHDETYVRDRWSEFFDVLDYRPRGMNDNQDLVVLARR